MMHLKTRFILMVLVLLTAFDSLQAKERPDTAMMNRVFSYASTVPSASNDTSVSYAYTRFKLHTVKRNFTLMMVPTMFVVAHGNKREYMGEGYYKYKVSGRDYISDELLFSISTIPHHKKAMGPVLQYLTPKIYNTTMVEDYLLSPFKRVNSKFYKYRVTFLLNGTVRITYKPKRDNTQLVAGEALVDYYTGRVISCEFSGEYDMITFRMQLEMGYYGLSSLRPASIRVETRFKCVGNDVRAQFVSDFGITQPLHQGLDSLTDVEKFRLLRPFPLDSTEEKLLREWQREKEVKDSLRHVEEMRQGGKKKKFDILDFVGDNMLNRIKSHFGEKSQGYIRLNPLLNPLYMGYDHRKGFIYKFDLRGSYHFTPNTELTARLKAGYSFKQHQLYYRLPIYYYFNSRRNGYLKLEVGNGNHIRNTSIRKELEQIIPDSSHIELDRLNEFKYGDSRLVANYDLSDFFSFQLGLLYQNRTAIHKSLFEQFGWRTHYRSFAPLVELEFRPWGWNGPILTVDFDHGFKGILHSNTSYERWEMNGEYILKLDRLQSFQMRVGTGFYTKDPSYKYFLNYENFKENNIPGGWNDEWSGEFELLNSDTYNYSEYYVRANLTYESPLLFLSWLPWVGHYIEMERIYVSTLDVKHIHPYLEMGYGFTTRAFSLGAFTALRNRKFDGVGFKFGFELFRRW